ncbi:hypothetical protein PHYSODRAFT_503491 [Phytophthora sojae]|uniref:Transmembrane protein n=1 Tax=Phytophthora sojae (strain P6497) TaxID=1094619 RepID=G4ZDB2_PHYSP|nr:hypothetical protein PHYSODRAFT_503491 [Phytophthora sojae]EGZ16917.1 hypothetical protein PHYSODRAFT_503491 [Phytophthora sojae]|eukprot:XP_009525975.1 hypothetical protein PHYSODRAFT_503491 [Phytophthora sojae]
MPESQQAEAQTAEAQTAEAQTAEAPQVDAPVAVSDVNVIAVKPHKSTKKNEYRVLCCGNSWQDLLIIPVCLMGVYTMLGAIFALCTRAVLQTDDTNTALWTFFVFYAFFLFMLALVLAAVAYNRKMLKEHEDADPEEL